MRMTLAAILLVLARVAAAQPVAGHQIVGRVADETGGALPGVSVEARSETGAAAGTVVTSPTGEYSFEHVSPGRYQLSFVLINFASLTRRDVLVQDAAVRVDVVLHLSLGAEVTV